MQKFRTYGINDLLPVKNSFLNVIPFILLAMGAVMLGYWVKVNLVKSWDASAFASVFLFPIMALFAAYIVVYVIILRRGYFFGDYVANNIVGSDVWAYCRNDTELRAEAVGLGLSPYEFAAYHFAHDAHGFIVRYPLGGWFRRAGKVYAVTGGKVVELGYRVTPRGYPEENFRWQKVVVRFVDGSKLVTTLNFFLDHVLLVEAIDPDADQSLSVHIRRLRTAILDLNDGTARPQPVFRALREVDRHAS